MFNYDPEESDSGYDGSDSDNSSDVSDDWSDPSGYDADD